eukprot:gb/GECG01009441.1/.p1 GENE.gb/GECG01009441.1/~~gb/GECG01009441.1/.p1  ORF type:complete len:184 (+),score=16.89 gb/GECG01009441.1/:1-552(+)
MVTKYFTLFLAFAALSVPTTYGIGDLQKQWTIYRSRAFSQFVSADNCPYNDGYIGRCWGNDVAYECMGGELIDSGVLTTNESFGYLGFMDPSGTPVLLCMLIEFDQANNATGRGGIVVKGLTDDCRDEVAQNAATIYEDDCTTIQPQSFAMKMFTSFSPLKLISLLLFSVFYSVCFKSRLHNS